MSKARKGSVIVAEIVIISIPVIIPAIIIPVIILIPVNIKNVFESSQTMTLYVQ